MVSYNQQYRALKVYSQHFKYDMKQDYNFPECLEHGGLNSALVLSDAKMDLMKMKLNRGYGYAYQFMTFTHVEDDEMSANENGKDGGFMERFN